jgi:hypothetical protein
MHLTTIAINQNLHQATLAKVSAILLNSAANREARNRHRYPSTENLGSPADSSSGRPGRTSWRTRFSRGAYQKSKCNSDIIASRLKGLNPSQPSKNTMPFHMPLTLPISNLYLSCMMLSLPTLNQAVPPTGDYAISCRRLSQ